MTHSITVTIGNGIAHIGARNPAPDIFASALELPGGLVTYDIREPDAAPSAIVDDARAAAIWVGALFGREVGEVVAQSDDEVELTVELPCAPGADAAHVARLAFGSWLWRYWPVAADVAVLDDAVLRVELAAEAWAADDCFGTLQPAPALLAGQLESLLAMSERLADESAPDASPEGRVVLAALDAAVVGEAGVLSGADDAVLDALDESLTRLTSVAAAADPAPGWSQREYLADSFARLEASIAGSVPDVSLRRGELALAAGETPGQTAADSTQGSVDWTQVPPRVLDWSEETIRLRADPVGEDRVRVEVRVSAAPGAPSVDSLFARGYRAQGGLPVLVVPLVPDGPDYSGSQIVSATDAADVEIVDVYDAASVSRPRVGAADRDDAWMQREDARDLIRRRSAGVGFSPRGVDRPFLGESVQT